MPRVKLGAQPDPRGTAIRMIVAAESERYGMSHAKLAKKIKVPASTLSDHLKNPREMRVGELWDIMDALGVEQEHRNKVI